MKVGMFCSLWFDMGREERVGQHLAGSQIVGEAMGWKP